MRKKHINPIIVISDLKTSLYIYVLDNEVTSDLDTVTDAYDSTTVKSFSPVTGENGSIKNVTFLSTSSTPYTLKSRKKRSLSSENIIELMIVADKKMADYHGERLHNYIFTLMSIVRVFETIFHT